MSLVKNKIYKAEMHSSIELGRALQRLLWKRPLEHGWFRFEFAVAYVLFLRAERSLASIRSLVRLGLPDDAMALVRVMVERIINAEYILVMGMEAAADYLGFLPFSAWRRYTSILTSNPSLAPAYTPEQIAELEAAHNKARDRLNLDGSAPKSRYGRGHDWTLVTLPTRADEVDRNLKAKGYKAQSRIMYDATYAKSAPYLHGAFLSIARSMELKGAQQHPTEEGMHNVEVGIRMRDKEPRLGLQALKLANAAAFQMQTFLAQMLQHKPSLEWSHGFAKEVLGTARSHAAHRVASD